MAATTLKTYLLNITFADGTQALLTGIYSSSCAALLDLLDTYPTARRLSAQRI